MLDTEYWKMFAPPPAAPHRERTRRSGKAKASRWDGSAPLNSLVARVKVNEIGAHVD
jgi:hypothetical protein